MTIKVCCAIIIENRKVLVAQRGQSLTRQMKWEFPGGKIEAGESCEECIVREIKEELSLIVSPLKILPSVVHEYPDMIIELIPIVCKILVGTMQVNGHNNVLWLGFPDLKKLNWSDADAKLIKEQKELFQSL